MSCAHMWISPRRGFEVSFKTLSIKSLCYNSAEHQELTHICPPGSTAPSFQLLQSQWEIAPLGKACVFPPCPSLGARVHTLIYRVQHKPVLSCLPFMGAAPAVGAVSAPSSHSCWETGTTRGLEVSERVGERPRTPGLPQGNTSTQHECPSPTPWLPQLTETGNMGMWRKLESVKQPNKSHN